MEGWRTTAPLDGRGCVDVRRWRGVNGVDADQFGDAFAFGGHGAEDGAGEAFGVQFLLHAVGAGLVGLVDHEDVGDLHDAGLDGLDVVAHAGDQHDHGHLRQDGDFDFVLPHAHGFDDDVVSAGGVHQARQVGGGAGQAADGAARGHGADEDAGIGVVLLHADAVAQDGAAGDAAAGVHGEDRDGLPLLAQLRAPARPPACSCPRRAGR